MIITTRTPNSKLFAKPFKKAILSSIKGQYSLMNPRENIEEELNIMIKKSCIIASLLSIIAGVPIALLLDGIAMKIVMGAVLIMGGFAFWMVIVYTLFNKAKDKHMYYVPLCACAVITMYSIVLEVSGCTAYQNLPTAIHMVICILGSLAFCGVWYFWCLGYKAELNEPKADEVEADEMYIQRRIKTD